MTSYRGEMGRPASVVNAPSARGGLPILSGGPWEAAARHQAEQARRNGSALASHSTACHGGQVDAAACPACRELLRLSRGDGE